MYKPDDKVTLLAPLNYRGERVDHVTAGRTYRVVRVWSDGDLLIADEAGVGTVTSPEYVEPFIPLRLLTILSDDDEAAAIPVREDRSGVVRYLVSEARHELELEHYETVEWILGKLAEEVN